MCAIGNYLEGLSAKTGAASLKVEGGGLLVAGGGVVTGQPEAVAGGLAAAGAGGAVGLFGGGGSQIVGGVFQGLGGAGYSNFWTGLATAGTGYALGRLSGIGTGGYQSASQRQINGFMANSGTVAGGAYDLFTSFLAGLGPQQKACPVGGR